MPELFQGRNGQYYWHVKAANGQILCHSEGYTTKVAAANGYRALCAIILRLAGR